MTEMKCVQVFWRSGRDEERVRSWEIVSADNILLIVFDLHTLTSVVDILPITLRWLSTTTSDEIPSVFISWRASLRGLSPLKGSSN